MINARFTTLFLFVTALLAGGAYASDQAAIRGGTLLTAVAVVFGAAGLVGFGVLARVVVLVERQRRAR